MARKYSPLKVGAEREVGRRSADMVVTGECMRSRDEVQGRDAPGERGLRETD